MLNCRNKRKHEKETNLKTFFTVLAFLMSFAVEAAEFKPDSVLPAELQARISKRIESGCPTIGGIREVETTSKTVTVDQGIRDQYFTTELVGSYNLDPHPIGVRIWVSSIEWDISNPSVDKYDIVTVSSDAKERCQ